MMFLDQETKEAERYLYFNKINIILTTNSDFQIIKVN